MTSVLFECVDATHAHKCLNELVNGCPYCGTGYASCDLYSGPSNVSITDINLAACYRSSPFVA